MKTRTTLALGACLSLMSLGVYAQSVEGPVESSGDGYINVGGLVLKTGLGECLQSGTLSDDNTINKCAGIEDDVAAAEAAADAAKEEAQTAAASQQAAPAPAPTPTVDTRNFSQMTTFATNSASLSDEGKSMMSSLFAALSEYKGITNISVVGHTDSRGSEAYNQALSEQRAATIAAEIATQYPSARINVEGQGESSPVASNDTAAGRQQNRRVEIEITATRMIFN